MRFEQQQAHQQDDQVVSNGTSSLANGTSHDGNHVNGILNGFHEDPKFTNGAVAHDKTPFHGHNREEITRILLQSLTDLGYRGAAERLSIDSGYQLEIPSVASFRSAVLSGSWDEAEELLLDTQQVDIDDNVPISNGHSDTTMLSRKRGLPLAEGADTITLRSLIRQQKYLELLEKRELSDALHVLRNDITPLKRDTARLHTLSALMMCISPDDLRTRAQWDGAHGQSRQLLLSELSKHIAPSVMIPEHRLATLLTSMQEEQIWHCRYHNTMDKPSLYTDHECAADDFPLHTMLELKHHSDEVWHLAFSPQGKWLATTGKDGSVFVYDADSFEKHCEIQSPERSAMSPEQRGICHLSFSPDERYLLTASFSNMFTITDLSSPRNAVAMVDHFDAPVVSSAWLPDCEHVIVGTQSSIRPLSMYNVRSAKGTASLGESNEIYSWRDPPWDPKTRDSHNSFRITNVAVNRDGTRLAASTTRNSKIMIYDLETKARIATFPMDSSITSLNYSPEGDALLLNLYGNKILTIDSATGDTIREYDGAVIERFEIRSCFGGAGNSLVVSGSEGQSRVAHVLSEIQTNCPSRLTHCNLAAADRSLCGSTRGTCWTCCQCCCMASDQPSHICECR